MYECCSCEHGMDTCNRAGAATLQCLHAMSVHKSSEHVVCWRSFCRPDFTLHKSLHLILGHAITVVTVTVQGRLKAWRRCHQMPAVPALGP